MRVILKPTWPGTFRRNIRDEKGQIIETLEFQPGNPLDLSEEQLAAVKADIGKALCLAKEGADKPDWDATEAFLAPVAEGGGSEESPSPKNRRRKLEPVASE